MKATNTRYIINFTIVQCLPYFYSIECNTLSILKYMYYALLLFRKPTSTTQHRYFITFYPLFTVLFIILGLTLIKPKITISCTSTNYRSQEHPHTR